MTAPGRRHLVRRRTPDHTPTARTESCPNGQCAHARILHDIPEPGPRIERCVVFDCPCGATA